MWRSPFPLSPPVATTGNGFAPQANQQFPSGLQQPFPQTTSSQFTTPRPGVGPSFQPFLPPQASHRPLQSSMNNPQVLLGTSQVPDRSSLTQHLPPRGYPSPLPQSSSFNSPMWQMRNPRPSVPSPGLAPRHPYTSSTEPTTGAVPSLSQGPFVPSTVPTPVRSSTPLPKQLVPFPRGLDVPLQRPFSSPTMPLPVRIGPLPQRHSTPSPVPIPEVTTTTTPRPFTPLYGRVTTPSQRPLTPCTAPPPVRTTVPPQLPHVTSTHPSPIRIASPHQTFTPSPVPSVSQMVPVPPQRPFPPPAVQSAVCVTTLPQRPLVPSAVSSPERAIAPPQPLFASSIRPSPVGITSPPQRPFAPSTISPPGGFPTASPQQFIAPAVPSPRKVLSPPQQSVLPQKVSPPSPFNSPPNERFQPVPQQPFITPCTPPPGGVLTPPKQSFVQSPVPAIRGMTIPGQQPSPVINQSWPTQASQLSSPSVFRGPTSAIPSSLPSHSGVSFPMQQFSPPSNSPFLTASSGPSALSHGPSIAAALDRHIMEKQMRGITKVGVPREGTNMQPSLAPKQSSSTGQTAVKRSPSLSNTQKRASFHKEDVRGREHRSRRHYSLGSHGSRPRVSRCFSPPPPDIERVVKCVVVDEYYIKKKDDQMESCHVEGTENLSELHNRFKKKILNMESIGRADDDTESINSERSHPSDQYNSDVESLGESDITRSGNPVKSRLRLFPSDDEENSDEDSSDDDSRALSDSSSESDNGEGGDLSGDNDDDDEEEDHHVNKGPSVAEIRRRKIEDPRRLHPELWFNEAGETNDGPVCRCSSSDKRQGIRHGVYPGETVITPCNPMTNNADKLHHYWVTVTPHTNFMTSNPSIVYSEGKNYTFEGFSMFSHHPLEQVPLCSVIRFNIEYTLHVISQPVPENFCMKDLELFSEFLFYKVLELADWNFTGNVQDSCRRYHFMPRFVHRADDTDDSKACHELLSMSQVLSHVLSSAEPLIKPSHFELSAEKWEEYNKSCKNTIVLNPDKKPAAIRVDNLQFCKTTKGLSKGKMYPYIVHHSIRPVQMSFAGDPKYQKLLRTHNKLRSLISNTPIPTRKNQDKLVKLKIELENMRLTSAMRRDVVVEVSSRGMVKTGLKSDICQHALLLPVLAHHVRYHVSLHSLDEKMGYVFKDRALLQLALTHPSYHLNFGMNPDHARNSLSNCGVKQPRYGDRKIRRLHTRKKGITQLIRVMSNLGKMEEHQSIFVDDSGTLANSKRRTAKRKLIRGESRNMLDRIRHNERLEFLGDAVLELICSIHLYFMLPSKPEGYLAMYRSSLVQNKHLAQLAKKLGLSDYMQYSHGPDLCLEEDLSHAMANCFEALLGAMYLESGLKSATQFFTKLAFDEEELREIWTNLPKHPLQAQMPDGDRHLIASSQLLQKLQEFEEASGIEFTHIRLLARAFTHAQVGFNNLTLGSNQRMEFLGDSVLQFVVSVYLFRHFPDHHEGHLTLLRSSLVNHRIQAKLARELGLDKLINFGSKVGMKAFREKILADTLEAFVAALYVDKGLRHVEVFCRVCLFPRLEEFIINQDWMDAKSQLQQCCLTSREQGKAPDLPQYKVLQNKGPAHHKYYAVAVYYKDTRLGSGEGNSIQQAEMAAAKDALASHYFPELARQKRLLDRKHQDRRRNYWNKVPRREREKDEQDKDTEIQPRWEEMETFEVQERRNVGEKENMNVDQERENWEMENESTGQERENWEMENERTGQERENWEMENESTGQERENWEMESESTGQERENWEMEDVNLQERETWEKNDGNACGTTENRETECSDHLLRWDLCHGRANVEEEPKGTTEEWEREGGNILERWDGSGGQNVVRENLGDVNVDSKVHLEEEGRYRMDSEKGENDWTENWEVENTVSKENWEETDGGERTENCEEAGIERSKERCVKDGTIEHNVINSMKENAKNEHGETKELWEVD